MELPKAVMMFLLLEILVYLSSADTHSLQYFYTATKGINLPEFTAVCVMDGEPFEYYDSNIRKVIPKAEWIKKIGDDVPEYWKTWTEDWRDQQARFQDTVATTIQSFNQSKGIHTVQCMFGCELDDDGTTRGYSQYGYDGEDFISLDKETVSWTPAKRQALITGNKLESTGYEAKYCKDFLMYECINWLKKYVSYKTLERKVHPEVSVFQKRSPSPEVVCYTTGFFPKEVMITWQKDGEDMHEDVELSETLPNQDGSFQKRSILKVSAEELQKHTYTCVVQHSSLEKELVQEVPKGGESSGMQIATIIGVAVALIVLIAGVVGFAFCNKKNSGFKPVQQQSMSSSNGDSSSNSS